MKIHVFGGIALVGMALTSAIVWSATSEKGERVTRPALAASAPTSQSQPGDLSPESVPENPQDEHFVDRSSFTAGETLMMEGRLGHAVLPATSQSETFLFIDVTADASKTATVATPLELSIVIDRSGSMRGKRLDNAVDAARTAIDQLRDGDTVSVLTYNTRTEIVVAPTVIAPDNRETLKKKLRTIRAGGDTCISCGVESGMRLLGKASAARLGRMGQHRQMANPMAHVNAQTLDENDGVSRILLLSDGEATHGVRDEESFGRIADRSRERGVSITSIGVDLDYNERIMAVLARRSNGRHYFVESAVDLPQIFQQEMDSLAKTTAARTELRVTLAPGVSLEHVFDRSFELTGNGVSVNMGSFTAGENKTLLMRLRVPRSPAGERPIAEARLSYRDLVKGNDGASCEGELVARATDDPSQVSPLDGLVSMRISRSETAEALERANLLFATGREQEARSLLKNKRELIEKTKSDGWRNAPTTRRGDFDEDMSRQSAAISGAIDAFDAAGAEAAAGGGRAKASSSRKARKQVRMNQEAAFDMGL